MDLDPQLLLLLGLSAAFLAATVLFTVSFATFAQRRSVLRSMRSMQSSELPAGSVRHQQLAVPALQRVILPKLSGLSRRITSFSPPAVVRRLEQELVYAGSPTGWDGQRLLALKWLTAAVLPILVVTLFSLSGLQVTTAIFLGLLSVVIGYYLPEWILRSRSARRQEEIRRTLPDALDLLSITVQAGLGFDAAVEKVSTEMRGPLGDELYRVVQEVRLGKSRGEALRDLANRTTVQELKAFVMAMVQAEIFGISISKVLELQAEEMRVRRRQRAEEKAQKLPVKIVFPLILCIFPALMVVLVGPAAISLYQNFITAF
jgi:tight adherence protein C